jgi:hypothetical protein
MSATGRGAIRKANDGYATPGWCVDRLLERVAMPGGHWLEPCAGHGAIIEHVAKRRTDVEWSAIEIRSQYEARLRSHELRACRIGNFLELEPDGFFPRYDVVLTNPPYFYAKQFVERARRMSRIVVMLLRVNFLEGEKRRPWLAEHMPDVYVLPNRPSFTDDNATDATAYAWMIWEEGKRAYGRIEVLASTPHAERKKKR